MKLALIGFGQAGGKIVDKFVQYAARTDAGFVTSAIAVNSATADLKGLDAVPPENRVLIGQSRAKGHGVGADNELGAEIAEQDIDEIQAALDSVPINEVDAFLIVAGMGGGTGSGGAPVLARHLGLIYREPVYGLGILPGRDEGGIYTLNAARSLEPFVRETDNLLLFDNDAWKHTGESLRGGYDKINEEIVRRFGVILGAGEVGTGGAVAETVVDSSEVINTLGSGGISSVGYAVTDIEPTTRGFLSRFKDGGDEPASGGTNRLTSLIRKASLGRLTVPCEISSADRSLLVISGQKRHLNRKGFERGRKWIEEQTGSMEVRGGDYPLPGESRIASAVLFSGVTNVPRIKELQRVAIEAQENIQEIRAVSDHANRQLLDTADEIAPLF